MTAARPLNSAGDPLAVSSTKSAWHSSLSNSGSPSGRVRPANETASGWSQVSGLPSRVPVRSVASRLPRQPVPPAGSAVVANDAASRPADSSVPALTRKRFGITAASRDRSTFMVACWPGRSSRPAIGSARSTTPVAVAVPTSQASIADLIVSVSPTSDTSAGRPTRSRRIRSGPSQSAVRSRSATSVRPAEVRANSPLSRSAQVRSRSAVARPAASVPGTNRRTIGPTLSTGNRSARTLAVDVSANPNVASNFPASAVPAVMARVTGASGGGVTVRVASTGAIVWSGRPASVRTIVPPVMCRTRPGLGSSGGPSDGPSTGARTSSSPVPPGRQATVTVGPAQVNSP